MTSTVSVRSTGSATRERAIRHLHEIDDTIDPAQTAGSLSKAAAAARADRARRRDVSARILIFDEPTAALTSRETERLFSLHSRLPRRTDDSIFYISHRLDEILELSQRITVLRDGQLVAELDPETTDKDEMVRQMAGRPWSPRRIVR